MSEIRDKSHALIFTGKKDSPMYRIRKDIVEIKQSLNELKCDIIEIKELLKNGKI